MLQVPPGLRSTGIALALPLGARLRAGPGGMEIVGADDKAFPVCDAPGIRALELLDGCGGHLFGADTDAVAAEDEEMSARVATLAQQGALRVSVYAGGTLVAQVEPIGEGFRIPRPVEPAPDRPLALSRFACLRADGGRAVLESPLCHARLLIEAPALAALLAALARGCLPEAAAQACPELPPAAVEAILALLVDLDFAAPAGAGGAAAEASDALRQWEFHDLLFHARSRIGRHDVPVGGTFRFAGKIAPLPAVKPPMSSAAIALHRPDLLALQHNDMPLAAAMERRRSVRRHDGPPLDVASLGEFLFRVARLRERATVHGVELSSRPYPNGGASYELELYPVIDRCRGLLSGLYHYDPQAHALEPLVAAGPGTDAFIADATIFCGGLGRPQVLMLITARFQRVSWKYSAVAYATILKNVGALYQTMYLAATAMGLGPCALGSGNSDRFAALLGEDYHSESAVGEFMLS